MAFQISVHWSCVCMFRNMACGVSFKVQVWGAFQFANIFQKCIVFPAVVPIYCPKWFPDAFSKLNFLDLRTLSFVPSILLLWAEFFIICRNYTKSESALRCVYAIEPPSRIVLWQSASRSACLCQRRNPVGFYSWLQNTSIFCVLKLWSWFPEELGNLQFTNFSG